MILPFLFSAVTVCLLLPVHVLGGNWTQAPYGQTIMLNIAMVNTKVGFIAGMQNGEGINMLKTEDGAQTWNEMDIMSNSLMVIASAAWSETSAIFGGVGLLSGSTQYTTDGVHFTNASEPKVAVETITAMYTVPTADGSQSRYASVGQWQSFGSSINGLAVSDDGGASWTFKNVSSATLPAGYAAFPEPDVIYLSLGMSPNNNSKVPAPLSSLRRDLRALREAASGHLMEAIESTIGDDPSGYAGAIAKSTDGGDTWTELYSNDTITFNVIDCAGEQFCLALAGDAVNSYVYRTDDGGATWSVVLQSDTAGMMALTVLSEDEAWVGGGVLAFPVVGHAWHTLDGGETWDLTLVPDNFFNAFSFPDAEHGFATSITTEQQSAILIYA